MIYYFWYQYYLQATYYIFYWLTHLKLTAFFQEEEDHVYLLYFKKEKCESHVIDNSWD